MVDDVVHIVRFEIGHIGTITALSNTGKKIFGAV